MRVIKSVRVDEDLWKEAKELGLNISRFLELKLKEFIKHNTQEPSNHNIAEGGIRTLAMNKHHQLSRLAPWSWLGYLSME